MKLPTNMYLFLTFSGWKPTPRLRQPKYQCKYCDVVCNNSEEFENHQKHHHRKTHKCKECKKYFRTQSELFDHLEKHFWCKQCKMGFLSRERLDEHIETKHEDKKCEVCTMTFKHLDELTLHKDMIHNMCCECGTKFKSSKELAQHLKLKSRRRRSIQRFTCRECAIMFAGQGEFDRHMKSIHSSDRKKVDFALYQCESCPEKFTTEARLNLHVLLSHSKKRNAEETETRNSPPQKLLKVLSDLSNSPSYEKN